MPSDSIPRCIIIIVLVLLSAFFSTVESAFSHCNRIRIKLLSDAGNRRGRRALWILERFDRTLVAVLIGNNVVNTAGSVAATVLFVGWFGSSGTLISTVVMTVLIFLISETIPKNMARANSDSAALVFSMPVKFLVLALTPVVFFFTGIANGVKKLIGAKKTPTMTEDEFSSFIETVEEEGIIQPDEGQIIRSAIEFCDKTVTDVMRGRDEITAIERSAGPGEIKSLLLNGQFSRVPVYHRNLNNIVGIMQARGFLKSLMDGGTFDIRQNILPVLYVNPDMTLQTAFELMCRRRSHLAVVRQAKKTLGIITLEDILEEIVGDIYDEFDETPPLTGFSATGAAL